jgi:hypothetical protein
VSGKRYQSGYDDGFKAGQWAGHGDSLRLVREARDSLRDNHQNYLATNAGGHARRAADCYTCALLARLDAELAEAHPQPGEKALAEAQEGKG